ncbi:MAG: ABC transporter substrate-binding protein, partial [Gemmatimonas sp.]
MKPSALASAALGALALVSLGACVGRDEPRLNGDNGGTVVVAVPTDIRTLYPPMAEDALDLAVIHSVFDQLADISENLNTVGDSGYKKQLAESWTWASDSLSIAFNLNPAARWHDGQPVRAADVQFSFQAYTKGPTKNAEYLSNIDSVSVRDSLTAVVWYKRRMPQQFFQATNFMYVMPSHLYGAMDLEKLATDSLVQKPVGSGRFRFAQHVQNQRIELLSDTINYRGRAKLDRVVFQISDGA